MDILQNLTNLLGGTAGITGQQPQAQQQSGTGGAGGLSGLLNPAVLGSLASALLSSNKMSGISSQAARANQGDGGMGMLGGLLGSMLGGAGGGSGGGMAMIGSLFSGMFGSGNSQPPAGQATEPAPAQAAPADQQDKAVRVLRALVYAAKADGHIDADEQAALNAQVQKLNLGPQVKDLLRQLIAEPLDPDAIAKDVADPKEAAQLYGLSCAITGMDDPKERAYLDNLAAAFRLPPQAKKTIESQVLGQ